MAMTTRDRSRPIRRTAAVLALLAAWPPAAQADDGFLPHAVCYLWDTGLLLLHAVSDSLIGISYVAISGTLAYLVYRARRDIPFHWVVLAFGLFIVACGMTHFMELWTLWSPRYWLAGSVKLLTALASVATALVLPPLVPRALGLIETAKLSERRKQTLEATHAELASLYARVTELDRLKTQFFANVSHELRTPLTLVLGPVERLLAEPVLSPAQRHELSVVQGNARMLLKHVNDLLDVSKLEAGKMGLAYAQIDLAELVRLTASHFEVLAAERGLAFEVTAPDRLPAQVDPDKLQRIVVNLLSNAFKFTPDGGRIRCRLGAGERAVLRVEDSGPGVPPSLRQAIFDRFRQGDETPTRRHAGTGLGLAIAKDFAELHGGRIGVEDGELGGAAFVVELPLTAPAGALVHVAPGLARTSELVRHALEEARMRPRPATGPGEEAASGAEAARPGDTPLVLIVEDNAEMARYLVATLGADYRTEVAADGRAALGRLEAERPDLILTDVMMPEMSGDQLLAEVRRRPEWDGIPVMLVTAKADDALRATLLRAGAEDYVIKPFAAEELRARAQNLIASKRARDVLQAEVASHTGDLASLAREVASRTQALRAAERALREQHEWLRVTLRSIGDAVIATHADGRIRFMNSVAEAVTRWPADLATGRSLDEVFRLVNEQTRTPVESPVDRVLRAGTIVGLGNHTLLLARDGTEVPVDDSGAPIRTEDGTMAGIVLVFRDVTERRRAEDERTELLARERAARAQAEVANRAKDDFLATLSHELRTPLQAILGWSAAMQSLPLDSAALGRAVEAIGRNARAQAQLIDDLLDVSRIITGQLRLNVRPVTLAPVIRAAVESLGPAADARMIRVSLVLDPDAGPVSGDGDRLQQVVWNLVSNAIKFTPKGGRVQVTLERINSHVEIRVTDTGSGISREFLPFAFDRFRQAESPTTRRVGGLGLGLAIVRHLVELHGGTVEADSPGEGQGATFRVKLPVRPVTPEDRPGDADTLRQGAGAPAAPAASLAGVNVLLVEDEPDARDLLATVLEQGGANVTATASVAEAMDALRRGVPDVIVSDIEMPGEDGYALIRRIRALGPDAGGHVPALALTAYARVEDRLRALNAGFHSHVAKPVVPAELIALIAALARRGDG